MYTYFLKKYDCVKLGKFLSKKCKVSFFFLLSIYSKNKGAELSLSHLQKAGFLRTWIISDRLWILFGCLRNIPQAVIKNRNNSGTLLKPLILSSYRL